MPKKRGKGDRIKLRNNLTKVLIITFSWIFIWTLLFLYDYSLMRTLIPQNQIEEVYNFGYNLIGNVSGGLFGGILGGSLLVFKLNEDYRQKSFTYGILNAAVYFVLIYVGISLVITILFSLSVLAQEDENIRIGSRILSNAAGMLLNPAFWTSMAIWSLMVAGTQFMLQVNDKFGNGVLWRFLTGKYFHPREEKRIFMFLDIKSSTSIAEKIGHMKYFELLSQFYKDITDPIIVEEALIAGFAEHGYSADIVSSSQASATLDSLRALGFTLLLAVVAMAMVMMVLFDRVSIALLALLVLPTAVAAAMLVLWLHDKPLSFFACVGIIGMTGVVVNNALVLLYHYRQQVFGTDPHQWSHLLLEGAIGRVRPMLVTSLTTVAGLLPLAYGVGGYDNLMSPIALVIGWGMALSAPVVLLLIPAGYLLVLRRRVL